MVVMVVDRVPLLESEGPGVSGGTMQRGVSHTSSFYLSMP